ncbi:2-amino-4-hydroxy-6-hydroxymethyldihydropteridine diphosphokinase [Pontibacter sp. G13]|uniref:2-amino-4-hydroxy-6- hydroxymethyldihydropteridine diphosphokinase n=1 Tax=Pontibacter sp. G13 TaxID=3074898 RepID=UPI0028896AA7|nr:2-amino-4-hydroxy-6-hydroxymethyldihydropteridine diphosphokinase [Pontibacter sp. G13]WNJ18104.1 2-amino-4-hydroxy-6-hydroxymethyldihydropteridine diphosphokinase [Pontibacter sp. G13]
MKIIGLGSNLGDRTDNLVEAVVRLEQVGVELMHASSCYLTPPWGDTDQDAFVNAVVQVETALSPEDLLRTLLQIEEEMGRVRYRKWGPRLIDLDLIEYDGQVRDTELLKLPHPFFLERPFVMIPLAEMHPRFLPNGQLPEIAQRISAADREGIDPIMDRLAFEDAIKSRRSPLASDIPFS